MTDGVASASTVTSAQGSLADGRLRETTRQLEGVFVQYLMKALRSTVPDGGHADAPGAEMYGTLLDEHLAQGVADDARTGIAEALYRQLKEGASGPSEASEV